MKSKRKSLLPLAVAVLVSAAAHVFLLRGAREPERPKREPIKIRIYDPKDRIAARAPVGPPRELRTEPRGRARPESRGRARPETRPRGRSESRLESGPESRSESGPESRSESRPESRSESRPESRSESRPESRSESRPESRSESRSEAPQPESLSAAGPLTYSELLPRPGEILDAGGGSIGRGAGSVGRGGESIGSGEDIGSGEALSFAARTRHHAKLTAFTRDLAERTSIPTGIPSGHATARFIRDTSGAWRIAAVTGDPYFRAILFETLSALSPNSFAIRSLDDVEHTTLRITLSFAYANFADETAKPLVTAVDGQRIELAFTRKVAFKGWQGAMPIDHEQGDDAVAPDLIGLGKLAYDALVEKRDEDGPSVRRLRSSPAFARPIGR